ncbi:MAG TPA: carboxypeptidase-like regulatory domain-containing protein [Candidatus Acidoferrum sp.]|nr:carboxypeptidase-like regulatory domain-containing protein [Candidatus Acidoferrum sp.]
MLTSDRGSSLKKMVVICILAIIGTVTVFQVYAQSNGQFSQNGSILGRVTDAHGQPIVGAEISYYIEDAVRANRASGSEIITDSNGNYATEYSMVPSDLAANVGKLFITVKVGDQTLTRGGPRDSIEIKGGTTIKVDFQLGVSEQPPVVLIQSPPYTPMAEASSPNAPITISANRLSEGGRIKQSEDKNLVNNTAVRSAAPGFDAILSLVGIIAVVYVLMRKT